MPFTLRSTVADQGARCHQEYVVHAYVYGIMGGEVAKEGHEPEWISLKQL